MNYEIYQQIQAVIPFLAPVKIGVGRIGAKIIYHGQKEKDIKPG